MLNVTYICNIYGFSFQLFWLILWVAMWVTTLKLWLFMTPLLIKPSTVHSKDFRYMTFLHSTYGPFLYCSIAGREDVPNRKKNQISNLIYIFINGCISALQNNLKTKSNPTCIFDGYPLFQSISKHYGRPCMDNMRK